MAQKILAVFRQVQAARGARQQGRARLFFQAPDLVADGGLAQVQPFGGTREAARFLHGNKGAQQCGVEVHGGMPIRFMMKMNELYKILSFPS